MTAASRRPKHHWLMLVLPFAAGYYVSYLLRNVNAVIAPVLMSELALEAADLGLLTSAYLIAFGAFQIPLGILLDRFGPRRVEATLMLVAALGTLLFAIGHDLATLTLARGLIGFGVSACLMAAVKNFTQWYPRDSQASLTAVIMMAGGLGALSASVPLDALLPVIGWRGIFLALTALSVAIAAWLFLAVRDKHDESIHSTLAQQWDGVVHIFASRVFWRFAPISTFFAGGWMAIQGLWAVPWLMNVDGLTRSGAAQYLLATAIASVTGTAAIAVFATGLLRRGIRPNRMIGACFAASLLCQAAIVAGIQPALPLWIGFALFNTISQLIYTSLPQNFPLALAGRAITAINLMAFAGAFALQWGIGVAVDGLTAAKLPISLSYRASFAFVLGLQALALIWFAVGGRSRPPSAARTPTPLAPGP